MRLLHLIQRYYPYQGGSERYFQAFAERFVVDGAETQVWTTDAWDLEYFWDPSRKRVHDGPSEWNQVHIRRFPVHHLPFPKLTHQAIRRLMAESTRLQFPGQVRMLRQAGRFGPWVPAISRALRDEAGGFDLLHSANIALESLILLATIHARRSAIPHIVTPFLHLGEGPRSLVRRYYTMPHQLELLRQADGVMALTSIEAKYLINRGVPEQRIHIVGAGVDINRVTGGDHHHAREQLGIEGPIVLALGAAAFDKGTFHLVRAVTQLNRTGQGISLVIAGPLLSAFEQFLEGLDPDDRRWIHALGFVSENEKRDLLAAADVVALPSRTESYGIVFLEAWANGKPVIGARAGAIPAVVEHGTDGLLVEFGDVGALADAIRTLILDRASAEHLAAQGRAKVVDEDEWYQGIRSVYFKVLGIDADARTMPRRVGV